MSQVNAPNTEVKSEAFPVLKCLFVDNTKNGGKPLEEWTVGTKYLMECSSQDEILWSVPIQFIFGNKINEFTLVNLQTLENSNGVLKLVVTGYKPGKFNGNDILITDGKNFAKIENLEWEVKAVIEQGSQKEPNGPIGPFSLKTPNEVYVISAIILLGIIYFIWSWIKRVKQKREFVNVLNEHKSVLTPINKLNKTIRSLLRYKGTNETLDLLKNIEALEDAFFIFIMCQFTIPTLKNSNRKILLNLKKKHPRVYHLHGEKLRKLLLELKQFKKQIDKVNKNDFNQMIEMIREMAAELSEFQKTKRNI